MSYRKNIQSFAEHRIFKLHWKYNAFVWCRDLGRDICGNSKFNDFEIEPRCAFLEDKYFKVIDIDNKDKVRGKMPVIF